MGLRTWRRGCGLRGIDREGRGAGWVREEDARREEKGEGEEAVRRGRRERRGKGLRSDREKQRGREGEKGDWLIVDGGQSPEQSVRKAGTARDRPAN
eukprot:5998690-Pleurochrysis_carterae.AAC.3